VPLDAFGSVSRPLQSLDEVVNVLFELWLIRLGADLIDALRRVFPDVAPARAEIRLIAQLVEIANPRLRLLSGLLRSPLQDG
jgi:hypothetical protein